MEGVEVVPHPTQKSTIFWKREAGMRRTTMRKEEDKGQR